MFDNKQLLHEYIDRQREVVLDFDIETFKSNALADNPSDHQITIYSFSVGYLDDELTPRIFMFTNFIEFIEFLDDFTDNKQIELNAHNNFKYDSHSIRFEAINYLGLTPFNAPVKNLTGDNKPTLTMINKNGVFEKRVKSKSNLQLEIKYNNIHIKMSDSFPKTVSSLAQIGGMLLNDGLIEPDYLKTDYAYDKYDISSKLTLDERLEQSKKVNNMLNNEEKRYIYNDIYILLKLRQHFNRIFLGYDYDKFSQSVNILNQYKLAVNSITEFDHEILNKRGKRHFDFTKYYINGLPFNKYLSFAYKGGCNFYNQLYVGKILKNAFSMDRVSSYPSEMYSKKFPYLINDIKISGLFQNTPDNYLYILQLDGMVLNRLLNQHVKSRVIRQMIIKYYNISPSGVFLNSVITNLIFPKGLEFETLSYIKLSTKESAIKEVINDFFLEKADIKASKKGMHASGRADKIKLEKGTNRHFNQNEYDGSKRRINAIYGIPALRTFFPYAYINNVGDYEISHTIFKNNQRNKLFSIFVTAYAFSELIKPLVDNLTPEEIDDGFIYADTDSLYLKEKYKDKIVSNTKISEDNLSHWDIENPHIDRFLVINHKKYLYEKSKTVYIRAGGIPSETAKHIAEVETLESFYKKYIEDKKPIKALNSLLTKEMTITIYENETIIKEGGEYLDNYQPELVDELKKTYETLKNTSGDENNPDDAIYIEGGLFSTSFNQLVEMFEEVEKNKYNHVKLISDYNRFFGWNML